MTYEDLRDMFGVKKIREVLGVSKQSESHWHTGRALMPTKYWYMLKVRWPQLDLNGSLVAQAERYNRYWVARGRPGLLD